MPLFEQVLDKYPDNVKVVFKHYPLSFHKQALPAALASMAAGEQGRFWEFHDELFLNQSSLSSAKYMEIAQNMGLDLKQFSLDMMRPSIRKKIEQDTDDAKKAGVTGTPAIFVNGRKLKTRSVDALSKLIDNERARLQKKK
jgi:protein-disulfide isomerase